MNGHGLSERGACRALGVSRSSYRRGYKGNRCACEPALERRLRELSQAHVRWGCPLLHQRLRLEGYQVNHKRTERLYREMELALRRRRRRRLTRGPQPLDAALAPNQCWSVDFMSDAFTSRRGFRWFNVLDDFSRQALCVAPGLSFPAWRVIEVLEALVKQFGEPQSIRSDNGPEFIARDVQEWAHSSGMEWKFIQPGKPAQNGYIERFNGTFRTEVLDICAFSDLEESQLIAEQWRRTYNNDRPHQALDNLPPRVFLENWQANSLY